VVRSGWRLARRNGDTSPPTSPRGEVIAIAEPPPRSRRRPLGPATRPDQRLPVTRDTRDGAADVGARLVETLRRCRGRRGAGPGETPGSAAEQAPLAPSPPATPISVRVRSA
jgi:hypothetical protein